VRDEASALHPQIEPVYDKPDGPFVAAADLVMDIDSPIDMAITEAQMAKVERDEDGKIIWDPKHALIGGAIVAVTVGLLFLWFVNFTSTPPAKTKAATVTTTRPHPS
jgi:hypothetical protein